MYDYIFAKGYVKKCQLARRLKLCLNTQSHKFPICNKGENIKNHLGLINRFSCRLKHGTLSLLIYLLILEENYNNLELGKGFKML